MNLKEIFEKLDKSELEKFYNRFNVNSIEDLVHKVTLLYRVQFSCLTPEELNTIYKLMDKKNVEGVSSFLLNYMYVYNDNGVYILPNELMGVARINNLQYINSNRVFNYIKYYLNVVLLIPFKELKVVCEKMVLIYPKKS